MRHIDRVEIEISVGRASDMFPSYVWNIGSAIILLSWIVYYFTC